MVQVYPPLVSRLPQTKILVKWIYTLQEFANLIVQPHIGISNTEVGNWHLALFIFNAKHVQ